MNEDFVQSGLRTLSKELRQRLILAPFPKHNIPPDSNKFANGLLLSPEFYAAVPFEKFLLVQVCNCIKMAFATAVIEHGCIPP